MIKVNLSDGHGTGNVVKVTPQGEILTRQLKFGESQFQSMDATGTAFNFFKPRANERFPVTGTLLAVSEGKFLNGKTDDATVNVTIGGYYIIL